MTPGRSFTFVKENNNWVNYSGGTGAGVYGYAKIEIPFGANAVYATINNDTSIPAGPGLGIGPSWGTISKSGDIVADHLGDTFAEFALNLTKLGFDRGTVGGDCGEVLGSVIVKTRSSDSFTAELKDLAGPFDLGRIPEVDVAITGASDLDCNTPQTVLPWHSMQLTPQRLQWLPSLSSVQSRE